LGNVVDTRLGGHQQGRTGSGRKGLSGPVNGR